MDSEELATLNTEMNIEICMSILTHSDVKRKDEIIKKASLLFRLTISINNNRKGFISNLILICIHIDKYC